MNLNPYSARFGLIDSDKWPVCMVAHDDDRRTCDSEDGPVRHVVGDIQSITALHNAFPALEQLARFGLLAKAFCEEHGAKGAEAFDQASHAWQMRLNPNEARGHDAALKALRALLEAARALDGKEEP